MLQLKVRLLDISPMIWRRVLVEESTTLRELHGVLQAAMGWESAHLFVFEFRAATFGSMDLGVKSPTASLKSFELREREKLTYTYDMGDQWRHEIRVERRMQPAPKQPYPCCIAGARACPPEDSGGPDGYRRLRAEAIGIDAQDDLHVLGQGLMELLDTGAVTSLDDDEVRWRFEEALERTEGRLSVLDDRFSRKKVNGRLRRGDHRLLAEQNF